MKRVKQVLFDRPIPTPGSSKSVLESTTWTPGPGRWMEKRADGWLVFSAEGESWQVEVNPAHVVFLIQDDVPEPKPAPEVQPPVPLPPKVKGKRGKP